MAGQCFKRQGVTIIMEEAREPMGAYKKVHIQKISEVQGVKNRWREIKGRDVTI
jgi:hypothetical protein